MNSSIFSLGASLVVVDVVDDKVVDLIVVVVVVEVDVVEVEMVVGDFVVVEMSSASVVLGLGLGPAEVFSVFSKPWDSVVSLSWSSLLSRSSDWIRSI